MSDNKLERETDENSSGASGKKSSPSSTRQHYRWMGYSVEFIGVIGLFTWLGYLADQKFQTSGPWWLLTGFFVAFVGMIYLLLKETGSIK